MSFVVNEVNSVPRTVHVCWPKPDTRIPEAQRPKPVLQGKLDCEFAYYSTEDSEVLDAQVEAGELSEMERFERLVPSIKGLPLAEGETPYQWMNRHKYGGVVRAAIYQDWLLFQGEGRSGNSGKRRSR